MSIYDDPAKIALAHARANKLAAQLFQPKYFSAIMKSIPNGKAAFDTACAAAKLKDEEKAWLWNYLQHCDNKWVPPNVRDDPKFASSGW